MTPAQPAKDRILEQIREKYYWDNDISTHYNWHGFEDDMGAKDIIGEAIDLALKENQNKHTDEQYDKLMSKWERQNEIISQKDSRIAELERDLKITQDTLTQLTLLDKSAYEEGLKDGRKELSSKLSKVGEIIDSYPWKTVVVVNELREKIREALK